MYSTIRDILSADARKRKFQIAAILLSAGVVLSVIVSLIMPAVSATEEDVEPAAQSTVDTTIDVDAGKNGHYFQPNIVEVTIGAVTGSSNSGSGADEMKTVDFNLSYTLNAGDVGYTKPYIWYELDSKINIPDGGLPGLNDDGSINTGPVFDSTFSSEATGSQSGVYYITEDGFVIIKFFDEYLQQHDGQAISGTVSFRADVKRGDKEVDKTAEIVFNDTVKVTIDGFTPLKKEVKKSGTNNNDGTITWTITVKNPAGDNIGGYYLTDNMFTKAEGGITVEPAGAVADDGNGKLVVASNVTDKQITITYTTEIDPKFTLSQGNTENKVYFKDSSDGYIGEYTASVWENASITMSKSGAADYANDTVTWTIKVNNSRGVDLGGYTITDTAFSSLGSVETDQYIISGNKLTFKEGVRDTTIEIPYTVPLNSDKAHENEAFLKTPDEEGSTRATAKVEKKVDVSKSVSTDKGNFNWTITIKNNGKVDLKGYTVSDPMFAGLGDRRNISVLADEVPLDPINDYQIEGSTIIFSSKITGNVTISYSTKATDATQDQYNENHYYTTNSASLGDDEGHIIDTGAATGEYYLTNNIEKKYGTPEVDYDAKTVTIPWTIDIEQEAGAFSGLTLEDVMSLVGEGATIDSLSADDITLEYATSDDSNSYKTLSNQTGGPGGGPGGPTHDRYTITVNDSGFSVKFNEDRFYDNVVKVRITYKTVTNYGSAEELSIVTTKNTATFNKKQSDSSHDFIVPDDKAPYLKYDNADSFGGSYTDANLGSTIHKPKDLVKMNIEGTDYYLLKYHVIINHNGKYPAGTNVTLKDTLPQGFEIFESSVATYKHNSTYKENIETGRNWGNYYVISEENGRQVVTFRLEGWMNEGKPFTLDYDIMIPVTDFEEMYEESGRTLSLTNTIQDAANAEYEPVEQTQSITDGYMDKTGTQENALGTVQAGYITYSVDINPGRLNLSNSDTITLTDILRTGSYGDVQTNDPAALRIMLESLEIVRVNSDGSDTLLTAPTDYTYILDTSRGKQEETTEQSGEKDSNGYGTIYKFKTLVPGSKATLTFKGQAGGNVDFNFYYYNNSGYPTDLRQNVKGVIGDDGTYSITLDIPEDCNPNADHYVQMWSGELAGVTIDFVKTTYDNCAKLMLTVPDETYLKVKYVYRGVRADGTVLESGKDTIGVFNSISMDTGITADTASNDQLFVISDSSQATSQASMPIELRKVDIGTDSIRLNATFNLYKYDPNSKIWLPATALNEKTENNETYNEVTWGTSASDTPCDIKTTSDQSIKLMLLDTNSKDNPLLKLVETKQPDDYILSTEPYYFTVNRLADASKLPADVSIDDVAVITQGGVIAYDNVKQIDISVEKTWKGVTDTSGYSSKFQLYRSSTYSEGSFPDDMVAVGEAVDVTAANYTWTDLPSGNMDTYLPYYYYVKEVSYTIDGTEYTVGGANAQYSPSYNGNGRNESSTIAVSNESGLTVEKLWVDSKGDPVEPSVDTVDFDLYQSTVAPNDPLRVNDANGVPVGATKVGGYSLTADNNWQQVVSTDAVDSDGNTLYYYVVETTQIDGFTVVYQNNGATAKATISIRNRQESNLGASLPETGGIGKAPYIAAGALMSAAAVYYIEKRRISCKNNKGA